VAGNAEASWVRLFFGRDTRLRPGSRIRLTSLFDGAVQHLDARALEEWNGSSAYFNGPEVLVELLPGPPGRGRDRVAIEGLWAGDPWLATEAICGIDDRVLSSDPRAARMIYGGCSAWLINECFLSAGHCVPPSNTVVEFNVPLSLSGGTVVFADPADQYSIDPASVRSIDGGLGNDWGYFGVFPNTETGLTALQAQGARYVVASNVPLPVNQTVRLTGYGIDSSPPEHNQVQQTDSGPLRALDTRFSILQHEVDTTGGSSGSAVEDVASGRAIGIHTNAGCVANPPPYNHGTAINNPALQDALRKPFGVCAGQAACDDDGACESGEDCFSCPGDCGHRSPAAECGNNVCEVADGENCNNCLGDCNENASGPSSERYCCGDDVGCEEPGCTGSGNTCTEVPVNGSGYCCGDGLCENAEDEITCAVDCAAGCTPTQEATGLLLAHAAEGQVGFSWDPGTDPCLDHYALLGGNDPSSAGGFGTVASTPATSTTGNPSFTYYLVILESAGGEQGPMGHYGQ
jgi:V8-like Glu-specific endopeptidase